MSEYTNYYAVESVPLQMIKEKLEAAKLTALITDGLLNKPEDKWVVVESPRLTGFTIPGDYSTFAVLFDPWNTMKGTFPKVIKLFIEEDQDDWSISCSRAGNEKVLQFYKSSPSPSFSKSDRAYFTEFFGIPFEELIASLKPGSASAFCAMVKLPYFEMEQQDKLRDVIPPGKVIYSSDIRDQDSGNISVIAIHGDYDPHPAEGVEKPLATVLKDFRFILLAKCGHTPWIEQYAREHFYRIVKNVVEFIRGGPTNA